MGLVDCGHVEPEQADDTMIVIADEPSVSTPSFDGPRKRERYSCVERTVRLPRYMPFVDVLPSVMTSLHPDGVRCWRTTVRPFIGLFERRPSPALVRVAVKVTIDPAETDASLTLSVTSVGTSKHVL